MNQGFFVYSHLYNIPLKPSLNNCTFQLNRYHTQQSYFLEYTRMKFGTPLTNTATKVMLLG
ncbi:MAG TPA: hypothetical protein PLN40_09610, partial [Agitococcus sp.]|nr:hypothetical protein [Agitococcus sp.]